MNKKYLSQNWLSDEDALESMIRAGEVMRDDTILEIGPGPGSLTQLLTDSAKNVVAVEFDATLAENLHRVVSASNLEVHHADILTFDVSKMPKDYKVVANIPYHITAKIVQKFLYEKNKPALITLLVQKEVAERIAAKEGSMSIMSVSVQLYAEATLKEVVPAELFVPVPKVDSQIIQMRLRDNPLFEIDEKKFFRLVKAGFGERRKKLANALSGGLQIEKTEAEALIKKSNISLNARAQELSLKKWYTLYTNYVDKY